MNFSERLRKALDASFLNQSDLARELNIKPQSVQQWLSGKNFPRHQKVKRIAHFLNVSAVWLSTGDGPMSSILQSSNWLIKESQQDQSPQLPLVSWFHISSSPNHFSANTLQYEMIDKPCRCSNNAFALDIADTDMEPSFSLNERIIVDPDVEPTHQQFVIVCKRDFALPLLRQYILIEGQVFLTALKQDGPSAIIQLSRQHIIQGVVIAKYREYKNKEVRKTAEVIG